MLDSPKSEHPDIPDTDVLAAIYVGGEAVAFKTPNFGELSEITRLLSPTIAAFAGNDEDRLGCTLLAEGDQVTRALALATGKPADWIGGLGIEDFLDLLNAAMGVYIRLLLDKVYPRVAGMLVPVGEEGAGP